MREILFKGFTADENGTEKVFVNGEWKKGKWVEGDLLHDKVGIFICIEDEDGYNEYKVIPETVGQYTGLNDKNGKEIFEGDIIRYSIYPPNKYEYGIVNFFNGGFRAGEQSCNLCVCSADRVTTYKLEVISSIHSNPELLKGGAEE